MRAARGPAPDFLDPDVEPIAWAPAGSRIVPRPSEILKNNTP
jgi:hypothetical protein